MGIYFIFTLTKNSLTLFSHVKLPLYQSTSKSSELKIFFTKCVSISHICINVLIKDLLSFA